MAEEQKRDARGMKMMGILLMLIGILAMFSPVVAGGAIVYLIGGFMLFAGLMHLYQGFHSTQKRDKWTSVILGLIEACFGALVIGHPLFGMAFLTFVLLVYFMVEGIWKIIAAFSYRQVPGWSWLLISGLLSLILGLLIWSQWPLSGLWAVGILVGANLFVTGFSMLWLAGQLQKAALPTRA